MNVVFRKCIRTFLVFGVSVFTAIPAYACWDENTNPLRLDKLLLADVVFEGKILDRKGIRKDRLGKEYHSWTEYRFIAEMVVRGKLDDRILTIGLAPEFRLSDSIDTYQVGIVTPKQLALYCPTETDVCHLMSDANMLNRARQIPFILSQNCGAPYANPANSINPESRKTGPPPRLWGGFESASLSIEIALKEAEHLNEDSLKDPSYRTKLENMIMDQFRAWESQRRTENPKAHKELSDAKISHILSGAMSHLETIALNFDIDPAYRQRFIDYPLNQDGEVAKRHSRQ